MDEKWMNDEGWMKEAVQKSCVVVGPFLLCVACVFS